MLRLVLALGLMVSLPGVPHAQFSRGKGEVCLSGCRCPDGTCSEDCCDDVVPRARADRSTDRPDTPERPDEGLPFDPCRINPDIHGCVILRGKGNE